MSTSVIVKGAPVHHLVHTTAMAAIAVIITGCSAVGSPASSYAPERTLTATTMPEVTIGPAMSDRPLTSQQISALATGSVSAAVDTLTVHGYEVTVVGSRDSIMKQGEWDFFAVVDITVDGKDARVRAG